MSLQFVLGPSGSGKSEYLQDTLVKEAMSSPERKFLLVVPDQYNMKTQKDLVLRHPDRAFSNIEVLSFSRLSHRILEEVGGEQTPVLDDTGKSLIIRHVSEEIKDELNIMGKKLYRIGFVHEIKSAISEFMQYGIKPDEIKELISYSADRPALCAKLGDLELIYRSFLKYKEDKFLTREETLDIVQRSLHKSELVKNATIIFDGFTGFTPIQERVIQELLVYADRVCISLEMDENDDPYVIKGEQELFYLSKKTMARLGKLADRIKAETLSPVMLTRKTSDDKKAPEIRHLEKNIFRYPYSQYEDIPERLHVYQAKNVREEITDTCQRIRKLTDEQKLCYRDIAVVVGSMSTYADEISHIAEEFGIPVYMDYSRAVTLSSFIEALRSSLDIIEEDYSIDTVIRHLRCGFSPISMDECDELENFLLRTGIRGKASYNKLWNVTYSGHGDESEEQVIERLAKIDRINSIRERLNEYLKPFEGLSAEDTVETYSRAFYEFMKNAGMYGKLLDAAENFEKAKDSVRSSEYRQIYRKVVDLLDQMVALTGSEKMSFKEYREILEAGYGEIKLGVIPQEADLVLVGDIERTRLPEVKALFFLGANDENIPGSISGGGLISDIDREFLKNSEFELAPTPKEQMYIQRLYLYMNMCKPETELTISFVQMDTSGKSVRPSYIIDSIKQLFPKIEVASSKSTHTVDGVELPAGIHLAAMNYANLIREYAGGGLGERDTEHLFELSVILDSRDVSGLRKELEELAFERKEDISLAEDIANKIYGSIIRISISRLEKYAGCAYAHFLSYGLSLKERPEFSFERNNLGDIYHQVLERFATKLDENNISWMEYTSEQSDKWIDEILRSITDVYGETILLSSARNRAMIGRMSNILKRTVDGLSYQIRRGTFMPTDFEKKFSGKRVLTKDDGTKFEMSVTGKIDRIDLFEENGRLYVKIIDYKSGNKDFDITSLYYGLQLQLAVYMKQAMLLEAKTHPGKQVEPAGMLYYHIQDPIIDADEDLEDGELTSEIYKKLRMKGLVNTDMDKLGHMDAVLCGPGSYKSDIIPVEITSKGELSVRSSAMSEDDIETVLDYADQKLDKLVLEIMSGNIDINPCGFQVDRLPCQYCDYSAICKIKSGIEGYMGKIISKEDEAMLLQKMKNELH